MRRPSYEPLFSVLVPKSRKDLFFLNMRVYEILPCASGQSKGQDGEPVSVVWCAVHDEKRSEPMGHDGALPPL